MGSRLGQPAQVDRRILMDPAKASEKIDDSRKDMDDPRLLAVVREYMAAVESGRRPKRHEFVARHPEIAADLSACLQGLAFVNSAAAEVNGPVEDAFAHSEVNTERALGDFRLLREIGRGGMGVVYEAIQLSLGRRVAVKILPMTAALDPRHLERFRNEAQAAAQLHHTNIVPVYAVGCERSVHFYAMQLIDGQSLAQVIEELRQAASFRQTPPRPSSDLPYSAERWRTSEISRNSRFEEKSGTALITADAPAFSALEPATNLTSVHTAKRLEYFRAIAAMVLQAAEALAYAHRLRVVHRDIKPANLLLDSRGTLWITDFGLAQMYSDSNLTQTGDLLGTLRYMSPEQASGRAVVLDQRTDIYSLGITFYELLTLERAFPGTTREQLMQQIKSVEPRSPRSIDRKIPVELENIICKATAKEAGERYPSAEALAEDIQRFLHDEPVLAKPPSLWNKAVKWTWRHRTATMYAMIVLLLGFVGAVVSGGLIAREQRLTAAAYVREQHRAQEANQQRELAQRNFTQARQAVDFFTLMTINDIPPAPDMLQVRRGLLEASLNYYQSFLEQQPGDSSVDAQLNAAKTQVTTVLAELGAVDEFMRADFEVRLLAYRFVQEDLGLSPAQVARAESLVLHDPSQLSIGKSLDSMTSPQIRELMLQESAGRGSAITEILTPLQSKRLHEISRQIRGVFAFSDPDVAAALSLTPTQKEFLRTACAEIYKPRGPDLPTASVEKAMMQTAVAALLARMDSGQVREWQAMTGRTYYGSVPLHESWFMPARRDLNQHGPATRGTLDSNDGNGIDFRRE
jgi:serine/threonine protein kinase